VDVSIVGDTTTAGALTNSASVISDTADPVAGHNSESEQTTINTPPGPSCDG